MKPAPSRSRRRVAVSLTALVDLLFVILFLQQLQLQKSKAEMAAATKTAEEQRDAAKADSRADEKRRDDAIKLKTGLLQQVEDLTGQLAVAKSAAARSERERDEQKKVADEYRARLGEAEKEVKRTNEQAQQAQRELAATVSQIFSTIDAEAVAKALENGAPNEDLKRIQKELEAVKDQTTAQAIQMLRRATEVQKRVDIWEVHLYRDGSVRVRSPGREPDAIERNLDADNEDAFTNEFVQIATSWGAPKSLVLILYTHENAKGGMVRGVQAALDQVKTKWAADLGEKKVTVSAPSYMERGP